MRSVIKREFWIRGVDKGHIDHPSSYEEADKIAGARLDRRKNYAIIDGRVCEACTFTGICSGCATEYAGDEKGYGCSECGFHGAKVQSHWLPINYGQ